VKALQFRRQELRYVAAAVGSRLFGADGAKVGPLRLADLDPLPLPTAEWVRIRPRLTGICGSDLTTVAGESSRYFEPYISFPFVLGHEIVADDDQGRRVVLEPVLGHAARGFEPPPGARAPGDGDDYGHLLRGDLDAGIQTGFCASTGGGWATELVAHPSQLHLVPGDLSDEDAVLIEPLAVAVHAAFRAAVPAGGTVAVIGAGTMGLLTVAALRKLHPTCHIIVGAKYRHQEEWARKLGADLVVQPNGLSRAVRRAVGCLMVGDDLSGGAEVTVDSLGTSASIRESIGITRPRGRVVLLGMPATVRLELTALWHRETELVGSYCYCTEQLPDGDRRNSFALAVELAAELRLGGLVSATYPLDRYTDAIAHAAAAGPRQAVKVCFDPRTATRR
jgi:threonine dehydrogenase-like Zn-dependent dehydrogenase